MLSTKTWPNRTPKQAWHAISEEEHHHIHCDSHSHRHRYRHLYNDKTGRARYWGRTAVHGAEAKWGHFCGKVTLKADEDYDYAISLICCGCGLSKWFSVIDALASIPDTMTWTLLLVRALEFLEKISSSPPVKATSQRSKRPSETLRQAQRGPQVIVILLFERLS